MDYQDHVRTQFDKQELILIASSLGMSVSDQFDEHVLIDKIRICIEENGIPENSNRLVDEFIRCFRLLEDSVSIHIDEFKLPECYGYCQDKSLCDYCIYYLACGQELINSLPECYGIMYNDHECKTCMVKNQCMPYAFEGKDIAEGYEVYLFKDQPFISNILQALAVFRHFWFSWPLEVLVHKANRLLPIDFRGASVKRLPTGIIKDALYLTGEKKQKKHIERRPITFNIKRTPILKEGLYPIREDLKLWE